MKKKVREILNVKAGIKEWRVEKKGGEVKLPRENWVKKQNEKKTKYQHTQTKRSK